MNISSSHSEATTSRSTTRGQPDQTKVDWSISAALGTANAYLLAAGLEQIEKSIDRYLAMEQQLREAPDGQVSLTDPDARSMATSSKGTGVVGYNVQTAVDTRNHLIVAHEVTNVSHDRAVLATMAEQAREATGSERLSVVAVQRGGNPGVRAGGH